MLYKLVLRATQRSRLIASRRNQRASFWSSDTPRIRRGSSAAEGVYRRRPRQTLRAFLGPTIHSSNSFSMFANLLHKIISAVSSSSVPFHLLPFPFHARFTSYDQEHRRERCSEPRSAWRRPSLASKSSARCDRAFVDARRTFRAWRLP